MLPDRAQVLETGYRHLHAFFFVRNHVWGNDTASGLDTVQEVIDDRKQANGAVLVIKFLALHDSKCKL